MHISRGFAILTAVGALGLAGMGAGCGDDETTGTTSTGTTSSTTTTTTTTTTGGGSGGMGMGGGGGTGGSMGQNFGFTLNGTGYGPHADATIYVTAVADGSMEVLQVGNTVVPQNGDFTITGELAGGLRYTVGYFADINGNMACDAAPTDHVWIIDDPQLANPVSADITIAVTHNTMFGACQ